MLLMHANDREDIQEAYAGDIVALAGLKDTTTGDTLCAPNAPIILERMEFPEPVIELSVEPKTKADQEKMGIALNRLAREDPSFRVSTDHEIGPDHHQGHGRAPPRNPGRSHEARVQGRGQCRRAAGGVSRISRASRSTSTTPTRSSRAARASSADVKVTVNPGERGSGFSLHRRDQGRQHSEGIYPVGREGHARDRRDRIADRLPDHRFRGPADRRRLPRRRLVGAGVRNLRAWRDARSGPEGRHQAARADHEGRGRDPGGLSGRRHRRHEQPSWPDPGHRQPRQRAGGRGDGAAGQHVRLCEPAALVHPGPRAVQRCSSRITTKCRRTSPTK